MLDSHGELIIYRLFIFGNSHRFYRMNITTGNVLWSLELMDEELFPLHSLRLGIDGSFVVRKTKESYTLLAIYRPSCKKCNNGTYTIFDNSTVCEFCPPTTTSNDDHTDCIPCPSGTSNNGSYGICSSCETGFYAEGGAKQCRRCPSGFQPARNYSACVPCELGKYSNATTDGVCKSCQSGFVATSEQSTECVLCSKGTKPADNQSMCIPCTIEDASCNMKPSDTNEAGIIITVIAVVLSALGFMSCIVGCAIIIMIMISVKVHSNAKNRQQADLLDVYLLEGMSIVPATDAETPPSGLNCRLMCIPFSNIKDMTVIGSGGSGSVVFKGTWDFKTVAIKMFRYNDYHREQFETELNILA